MKIGVNCFLLGPEIGGLGTYFLTLFDELLRMRGGHQFVFFHFEHNREQLRELKTDIWRENAVKLRDQKEISRHLDRIDLLFCPFGSLYPRPVPLPTAVTLADIQSEFHPEFFSIRERFDREYHFRASTRMATRVVTISEFSKKTIVAKHGVDSGKIDVIPLSANELFRRPDGFLRKPGLRLPEQGYIFYPANRWLHKNHDGLLKALLQLKTAKGLKIPLVATGHDVPCGYRLREMARRYGLRDQLIDAGFVGIRELGHLYRNARFMVFPSLFEGFGIPLLEAMASGCPVACANATCLPEVGADAAEYFDPRRPESIAEAIERLWFDGARRRELAEKGALRCAGFSRAKTAAAHVETFEKALRTFRPQDHLENRVHQYSFLLKSMFKYRRLFLPLKKRSSSRLQAFDSISP